MANQALQKSQQQVTVNDQSAGGLAKLEQRFPADKYIVLAPKTHFSSLPVASRMVVTEVSVRDIEKDTFPLPGKERLLGKVVLRQIANAAGISWISERRMDDGAHPHFCHMEVTGRIRMFDGSEITICGSKGEDLRDDAGGGIPGKDLEEILSKAKERGRDPTNQIREARKFLFERVVSKARNRAIADALGIKRAYTREELAKPFIIPKLALDTNHPAAQTVILASMAGSVNALFGAEHQALSPPERVLDAELGTGGQPSSANGEEASVGHGTGASNTATPSSEEFPYDAYDADTGEVFEDPTQVVMAAWKEADSGGMSVDLFVSICKTQTGKTRKEDMSVDDANAVLRAVRAYLNPNQGNCPV